MVLEKWFGGNKNEEVLEEKPAYLEDVPGYQKSLQAYNLYHDWPKLVEEYGHFEYDKALAQHKVDELKKKYGSRAAHYSSVKDPAGKPGFSIAINRPFRDEFEDILDDSRNILPRKTN